MKGIKSGKVGSKRSLNLIWVGAGFSVFYWILESVRDVLLFGKGTLPERIFLPDGMSFWMRLLVVCLLVLFSVHAQALKEKMEDRGKERAQSFKGAGIILTGLGVGLVYWILESVRDAFIFGKGPVLNRILTPDSMSFWMRLLAIFILLLFSVYVQSIVNERRQVEEMLRKTSRDLKKQVAEKTYALFKSDKLLKLLKRENEERHRVEEELRRVNRALKTLSESNKALVHATEEIALLDEVCNILVGVGGYRLAWVGFTEQDEDKSIRAVSKAGRDEGYLEAVKFTWKDTGRVQSPVGRAIRSGRYCIVKNRVKGSEDVPWCSQAAGRGYASSISLPLSNNGLTFGALNIYAAEPDSFDVEEVKLLKELADDLSFGITVLRAREAHRRSEEEKEKMQTQLLQAQKMEAVGILAGGIAHDFNNLLTAILGCVEMAMLEVEGKEMVYRDLKEIQVAAERAANLTGQLLLFSRKQPMKFSLVDLNDTIKNLLKMLRRLIAEDIEVITDLDSDLWNIRADRGTMEQVIMNLAINAGDAMPEGGHLTITSKNVELDEAQCRGLPEARPGKWIRLSVSDTGVGMDGKTGQHIFEPFYSTKELGEGTGLGLSVVYGIVKQHEGWMHVTSQPGRGSTFTSYLPAVSDKIEEKEEESVSMAKFHGGNKRILVVEDEERVRVFTKRGLDRNGYVVFAAGNAGEATEIFQKEDGNFNLVLSDVVLPDRSGIELVEEFISRKPDLRVLLSSGYVDHKSQFPVIQKRGFQFLEKPYTLGDLLRVLREVDQSDPA